MKILKICILAWLALLAFGTMAEMNRSAYSYEKCDRATNNHSLYLKLAPDQYAQVALWGDSEIQIKWKLLKESKDLFFLRNLADESHTKTIFMNKDLYYVVDEKVGGAFRIKNSILQSGNSTGQKVGIWLNCPNESASGSDAIRRFKEYTAKLQEKNRQAESDRMANEFVNGYMSDIRRQCGQFQEVKQRCATAGNYEQCMKILLPALGSDSFLCLALR